MGDALVGPQPDLTGKGSGEQIRQLTAVSAACGFSTIRNFNRVFKEFTGYTPHTLPDDYLLDTDLRISGSIGFDPTHIGSELVIGDLLRTELVEK